MSHWKKTYAAVLAGNADANIDYGDLCVLLQRLGYIGKHGGGSHAVSARPAAISRNVFLPTR